MGTRSALLVAAAVTLSLWPATDAAAQQSAQVRRPFRGIFGAPPSPNSPHSLFLNASVYAAYDDNLVQGLTNQNFVTPWLQKRGHYQGANAGLDYTFSKSGRRFDFGGHAGAQARYYHHRDRSRFLPSYQGDLMLSGRLTRSLSFAARQSAAYTSNYNGGIGRGFGQAAGHQIGLAEDPLLDLFEMRAVRLTSSVTLSQGLSRYSGVNVGYQYRDVHVFDNDVPGLLFDYGTHSGTVGIFYNRPMTQNATLNLGYDLRASDRRSRAGEPELLHNVNAGVDYGRALSFSRRTTLTFSTGTAIAMIDSSVTPEADPRTEIRLIGNAALIHEIGRTWTAQLAYSRNFRTRDGVDGLFFTDAVNASLVGLITRRLEFTAGANWANSSINGRAAVNGRHRGQSASARLQYALSSFAALYAQYVYYQYRFSSDVVIDPRLARRLDRQGVRVGLTTSIPLIR